MCLLTGVGACLCHGALHSSTCHPCPPVLCVPLLLPLSSFLRPWTNPHASTVDTCAARSGIPPAPRGTPQIEVTFEVDANGILNVGAEDKGTGKKEKITITAEKGRLSQEEIERMVKEAEEFAEQDKKVKAKIDARNQLETYVYNMKSTVEDKLKDKISEDDKEKVQAAIKEAQEWLEENHDADADEYKDK